MRRSDGRLSACGMRHDGLIVTASSGHPAPGVRARSGGSLSESSPNDRLWNNCKFDHIERPVRSGQGKAVTTW